MTTANLAVADNDTVVQYESTGESVFAYPFPILAGEELKVSIDGSLKTEGVHYSVAGLGDAAGGTVTFGTATTAGQRVTLWLELPIKRLTGFSLGAATLLPQALNTEFVRQVRVDQMLRRDIARGLRIPVDDPEAGQDLELPTASLRANQYLRFDAFGNPEVATELTAGATLSRATIGAYVYPPSAAELGAGVTVVDIGFEYGYVPRYGNTYAGIVAALAQAAESTGTKVVRLQARVEYDIGANTIAIPDGVSLVMNGAGIVTTDECAITFGNGSALYGYDRAYIETSGAAGAALKKADTAAPNAWYIYGWPALFPTTMGTAGSIGLDITAAYKGIFEIGVEGYETNLLGGSGDPSGLPQTYYNEIRSPRVVCTDGTYGIRLRESCNGTTISNPQINGAGDANYFIHAHNVSGLTILGGYCEGAVDDNVSRGLFFGGFTVATVIGTVSEIATSLNTNFAFAGDDTASVTFISPQLAGGWGSSDKVLDWQSSAPYNWLGGAPSNSVLHLGQTSFPSGETNGTARLGRLVAAGKVSAVVAAAADTAHLLENTADGLALEVANNSAQLGANRPALVLNRKGGPGYALAFQNNGAAAGGIVFCAGTPEAQITAAVGTLAVRTDGGANTTLYVKESGTGNTGWVAK